MNLSPIIDFINQQRFLVIIIICLIYIIVYLYFKEYKPLGIKGIKKKYINEVDLLIHPKNVPKYDYEEVIEHIKKATYPAVLGSMNMILYNYMKTINHYDLNSPEDIFLWASIIFFITSVWIGLTISPPPQSQEEIDYQIQGKQRAAFQIVILFIFGIMMDILGVVFLLTLMFVNMG